MALLPIADARAGLDLVAAWNEEAPDAASAQRFVQAVSPLLQFESVLGSSER